MGVLERRDRWCTNGFSTYRCSKWHSWGRWALLALVIAGVFLFFFLFACASARRRRRQGLQPYMGTGWTTYRYNNNNNNNQYPPQPPPAYTPADGYYGPNPNYYGHPPPQQQGVELQPPQNAYRGDNYIYPPPSSPPPAHMPKQ